MSATLSLGPDVAEICNTPFDDSSAWNATVSPFVKLPVLPEIAPTKSAIVLLPDVVLGS